MTLRYYRQTCHACWVNMSRTCPTTDTSRLSKHNFRDQGYPCPASGLDDTELCEAGYETDPTRRLTLPDLTVAQVVVYLAEVHCCAGEARRYKHASARRPLAALEKAGPNPRRMAHPAQHPHHRVLSIPQHAPLLCEVSGDS